MGPALVRLLRRAMSFAIGAAIAVRLVVRRLAATVARAVAIADVVARIDAVAEVVGKRGLLFAAAIAVGFGHAVADVVELVLGGLVGARRRRRLVHAGE